MNKSILNIANFLTLLRLAFVPVIVYGILSGNFLLAAVFFLLSNITDIGDGFVARRMGLESDFGEYFDFVVDFTGIYAVFISLWIKGLIGAVNTYLMITGTAALLFIAITLSVKANRLYMPHRLSSKILAILVSVSFYLFFLEIPFADFFLLLSFLVIYFYTIPDYIALILKPKGAK